MFAGAAVLLSASGVVATIGVTTLIVVLVGRRVTRNQKGEA